MTAKITVELLSATEFRVTVAEGPSRTTHTVSVSPAELKKYGAGATAERLLTASFEFLLDRERKESILARFALSDIEGYFPEYPRRIHDLL